MFSCIFTNTKMKQELGVSRVTGGFRIWGFRLPGSVKVSGCLGVSRCQDDWGLQDLGCQVTGGSRIWAGGGDLGATPEVCDVS